MLSNPKESIEPEVPVVVVPFVVVVVEFVPVVVPVVTAPVES